LRFSAFDGLDVMYNEGLIAVRAKLRGGKMH